MTSRENKLRAIRFEKPDYIPMNYAINSACWHHYDQNALQDLMEEHSMLFPDFKRQKKVEPHYGLNSRAGEPYTDVWGCVWKTTDNGITGSVHGHPLADWAAFDGYEMPDPKTTDGRFPKDWEETAARMKQHKADGGLVHLGLNHGHTFLRLQDIRGYENLLFDMFDKEPRLTKLIAMVEEFNYQMVLRCLEMEPDIMGYGEDLGMQIGPMISPDMFRTYIKPSYRRIMKPARDAGVIVHMHSDGDIRDLVDDLIDGGVEVINLQDLVNGIDWIAAKFSGKVCVDLDIDRQEITARGTPEQIDALIREEVEKIGTREGGLTMVHGLYPGTPIENVKATMDAMEKYSSFYS